MGPPSERGEWDSSGQAHPTRPAPPRPAAPRAATCESCVPPWPVVAAATFGQSTLAPDSLTILAYFGISLLISAPNCSGLVGAGSAPCCAKNVFISGVPRIRATSAFHLAMISFGVPAGAMKPHQV